MSNNPQHITYSYTDIQSYIKGTMPPVQMQQIELQAQHDQLLADAIAGYQSVKKEDSQYILANLQQKIIAQIAPSSTPIFKMPWGKLAIAASIITTIIVIGFIFQNNKNTTPQIAASNITITDTLNTIIANNNPTIPSFTDTLNKPNVKDKTAISNAIAYQKPSTKPAKNIFSTQNLLPKKLEKYKEEEDNKYDISDVAVINNSTVNEALAKEATFSKPETKPAEYEVSDNPISKEVQSNSPAAQQRKNITINQIKVTNNTQNTPITPAATNNVNDDLAQNNHQKKYLSIQVKNANGTPIPNAKLSINNVTKSVTDKNGKLQLLTADTTLTVTASAAGYSKRTQLLSENNNTITLNPAPTTNQQEEVGYSTTTKINAATPKVNGSQLKTLTPSFTNILPKKGVTHYANYIANNNSTTYNATVTLQFNTSRNGKAINIVAISNTNTKATDKAIQLLKHGPRFTVPKKTTRTGIITLNL